MSQQRSVSEIENEIIKEFRETFTTDDYLNGIHFQNVVTDWLREALRHYAVEFAKDCLEDKCAMDGHTNSDFEDGWDECLTEIESKISALSSHSKESVGKEE